jgi:CheY-like chemotaxis protein
LNCAATGLSAAWIDRRLQPLMQRYSDFLQLITLEHEPAEAPQDEADWDILFVGISAFAEPSTSFEAALRRIAQHHALQVIVAIAPSDSPLRHADLFRAGAVDVVAQDADDDLLERAFDHAISVAQSRRQQVDSEKLRIISQLSISVNHEINNPLAGLMGTAELMSRDNKSLDEKGRRDLYTIITQCRRIQEITTRLKHLNHLRTVPYGQHDSMLDLAGEFSHATWAPTPAAQQFLETPRILVVDDNPLIVDLISRIFEQRYDIDAASCASDALSKLEQTPVDLVLIDLILPEMNGLELFRAIRRLRPQQKALLTTAYQGDARVEQAIHEGALGCIYKPFQLEELEKALDDGLKK